MSLRTSIGDTYAPRILRRAEAARYVGVSANKFDELVRAGTFPPAKKITSTIKGWDRSELDLAVDGLEYDGPAPAADTSWDD